MISSKLIPCSTMEAILVVKDYQDGVMNGILRHPRLEYPVPVSSISHAVLILDGLLDLEDCPESPLPLVKPIAEDENAIATFQIHVLFREFHTWQGRLIWKDRNQEASFRSILELMQLLDEVLGC